jgi:hypothetical protein
VGWDVDDPALRGLLAAGDTANHRPRSPVQLRRSKAGEEHKVALLKRFQRGGGRLEEALGVRSANRVRDDRVLEQRLPT